MTKPAVVVALAGIHRQKLGGQFWELMKIERCKLGTGDLLFASKLGDFLAEFARHV